MNENCVTLTTTSILPNGRQAALMITMTNPTEYNTKDKRIYVPAGCAVIAANKNHES